MKKKSRSKGKSVTFEKIGKEIDKEVKKECFKEDFKKSCKGTGGFTYFLGFLGAAIYYISTATGFWIGVLGVLKAIIWPLFLVYEVLKFIGA